MLPNLECPNSEYLNKHRDLLTVAHLGMIHLVGRWLVLAMCTSQTAGGMRGHKLPTPIQYPTLGRKAKQLVFAIINMSYKT